MQPEVIASLVSAAVALALAGWSLATTYRVRRIALLAEEHAKRTETVRIKALEGIDAALVELAEMILKVETLRWALDHQVNITESDPTFHDIGKARASVRRARYRFSPYLSTELLGLMDETIKISESAEIRNKEFLESLASSLRKLTSGIAAEARRSYLMDFK